MGFDDGPVPSSAMELDAAGDEAPDRNVHQEVRWHVDIPPLQRLIPPLRIPTLPPEQCSHLCDRAVQLEQAAATALPSGPGCTLPSEESVCQAAETMTMDPIFASGSSSEPMPTLARLPTLTSCMLHLAVCIFEGIISSNHQRMRVTAACRRRSTRCPPPRAAADARPSMVFEPRTRAAHGGGSSGVVATSSGDAARCCLWMSAHWVSPGNRSFCGTA